MRKKSRLNSEKIWKIQKKIVKWYGKCGRKVGYGKYGRKVSWIVKRYGKYRRNLNWIVKR
jgi:alkylated DNA nucleotide flippase Atl1